MSTEASSKSSQTKQVQCAKCGSCVTVCPVFNITGRETHTARGRIHLLATLTNPKSTEFDTILSKCLLCGACRKACPRGIDIPAMIIEARSHVKLYGKDGFKKKLIRKILSKPTVLNTLSKVTSLSTQTSSDIPKESGLQLRLAGVNVSLGPPQKSYIDSKGTSLLSHDFSPNVLYFTGCLANHLAPSIAKSSEFLLNKLCGLTVYSPPEQVCCGLAGLSAGDVKQAQKLARLNIEVFSRPEIRKLPIFTSCSTCFSSLRQYPELFHGDKLWQKMAEKFSQRVNEFSSFLTSHMSGEVINFLGKKRAREQKIFYHDPCHLRFGHPHGVASFAPITSEPRELLSKTIGVAPCELSNNSHCCGQGGLFHLSHPDISKDISNSLTESFIQMKADAVVTTCSGCLIQWKGALAEKNSKSQCLHLAEFIHRFLHRYL